MFANAFDTANQLHKRHASSSTSFPSSMPPVALPQPSSQTLYFRQALSPKSLVALSAWFPSETKSRYLFACLVTITVLFYSPIYPIYPITHHGSFLLLLSEHDASEPGIHAPLIPFSSLYCQLIHFLLLTTPNKHSFVCSPTSTLHLQPAQKKKKKINKRKQAKQALAQCNIFCNQTG